MNRKGQPCQQAPWWDFDAVYPPPGRKLCLFVGGASDGQWHEVDLSQVLVIVAREVYQQEWVCLHDRLHDRLEDCVNNCVFYIRELENFDALTQVFQGYSRARGWVGPMGES